MKNRLFSTKSDTLSTICPRRGAWGGGTGVIDLGHKKASKQEHDMQCMTKCKHFQTFVILQIKFNTSIQKKPMDEPWHFKVAQTYKYQLLGVPKTIFQWKHRKNCECCPGHYLIANQSSSMSWFKFRNLSEIVNCVTLWISDSVVKQMSH